jgi:hypothetical protein
MDHITRDKGKAESASNHMGSRLGGGGVGGGLTVANMVATWLFSCALSFAAAMASDPSRGEDAEEIRSCGGRGGVVEGEWSGLGDGDGAPYIYLEARAGSPRGDTWHPN